MAGREGFWVISTTMTTATMTAGERADSDEGDGEDRGVILAKIEG